MIDKELLELAAKAAGIVIHHWSDGKEPYEVPVLTDGINERIRVFDPLADDGDALRLSVKLNLVYMPYPYDKAVRVTGLDLPDTIVSWGVPPDPYAATRRAITQAAAAIGGNL